MTILIKNIYPCVQFIDACGTKAKKIQAMKQIKSIVAGDGILIF